MKRANQAGTLSGRRAPAACANTGSHSLIGAGSSSTTLYTPGAPRSTAATVASAASSTWMNENTPLPLPTIGIRRRRTSAVVVPPSP